MANIFNDFSQESMMIRNKMAIDMLNRNGQWSEQQRQSPMLLPVRNTMTNALASQFYNHSSPSNPTIDKPIIDSFLGNPISAPSEVKIELEKQDLWNEFHQHVNEMVVTKPGRRMFPTLRFRVTGLDPVGTYGFYIVFYPTDNFRYKFVNGKWSINGQGDFANISPSLTTYQHPDSPAPGRVWMNQPLSFHKIKFTNCPTSVGDMIVLNSMHKYQPRIVVAKLHDNNGNPLRIVAEYAPLETQFIAVTAYQNTRITQLKVKYNPFAKGFRQNLFDSNIEIDTSGGDGKKSDERKRKITNDQELDLSTTKKPRFDQQSDTPSTSQRELISSKSSPSSSGTDFGHNPSPSWPLPPIPNFYFAAEFARAAAAAAASNNSFYYQRQFIPVPNRPLLPPPMATYPFMNRPSFPNLGQTPIQPNGEIFNPLTIRSNLPAIEGIWPNFQNAPNGNNIGIRYTMY